MYSQEVHDIIERLKDVLQRERIKDTSIFDDLNMLSLYSELRSNLLHDLEGRVKGQDSKIQALVDNLDSADAALDNLEMSNKAFKRLLFSVVSHKKKSMSDDDED